MGVYFRRLMSLHRSVQPLMNRVEEEIVSLDRTKAPDSGPVLNHLRDAYSSLLSAQISLGEARKAERNMKKRF